MKSFGAWVTDSAAQAAASAPGNLVFKAEVDAAMPGVQQWVVAVLLCSLALVGALLWLRRRGGEGMPWSLPAGRLVTVLERAPLSPTTQLVVANYGERRLLLSVGPSGTQCLRDDPISITATLNKVSGTVPPTAPRALHD